MHFIRNIIQLTTNFLDFSNKIKLCVEEIKDYGIKTNDSSQEFYRDKF